MSEPATCVPEPVRFAVFEFDWGSRELSRNGRKIRLEGQPLQVLELLLGRPNDLITRDEVRHALWPDDTYVDFEHGINTAVKRLRAALGDSAGVPRFIETVPRHGYRFIYPLNGGAPAAVQQVRSSPWRIRVVLAVTLLLVATAAGFLVRTGAKSPRPAPGQAITSIVVLPFENLTGDPAQDYLADGFTEDLITDLSQMSGLTKVTSRTSAMTYKGARKSMRQVRADFAVDAAIEGSFTREGDQVRVVVQLIDTAADRHIWTGRYDGHFSSILALRGEIARRVAQEIQLKVTPDEQARLVRHISIDPDAHRAYLKARYLQSKWDDTENLPKAIVLYEEAIRRQPDFAAAQAGLGMSYLYLAAALIEVKRPTDVLAQARVAALTARQVDSESAEAYEALGWIAHNHDWDWANAERNYRRAIALNPNYEAPYAWLGHLLETVGRPAEAVTLMQQAHQLNPLSPHIDWSLAEAYMLAGDLKHAEQQCLEAISLHPDFWPGYTLLGNVYLWQRDYDRAIANMTEAVQLSKRHPYTLGLLASAYGLSGRHAEALAVADELKSASRRRFVAAPALVRAYASTGNREEAVRWLRQAYSDRSSEAPRVHLWGPVVDSLRGYEPYEQLLREMRVPSR